MTTESTTFSPEQAPAAPREGLWALVLDALRGARHDYTNLPLRRAILLVGFSTLAVVAALFRRGKWKGVAV